ncbi:MAG: hypothetical protein WDZ80_02060 [Candidatus Paceibacterota bacterium]
MALSKEYQEYHLTPKGWVMGSFKGDVLGSSYEIPIPKDRVLTIACFDELPSAFSEPFYYDRVIWKLKNEQLIEKLKTKWDKKPQWYGYDKMEKI